MFSRSLKAIPLALEVRALLDLDKPQATPFEVMRAILKARVDLLWFGGIGTYIRASGETTTRSAIAPMIRSVSRARMSAPG